MDVIKIAKDSGFIADGQTMPEWVARFATLVRTETKEECAKKVEQFRTKMDAGIEHIAEAIRSL